MVMHIDLNSCFATIEQQANPHLRGRPVVVAAYTTPSGCIIAPSVEAKKLGIKVGMRVKEGRSLYRDLIVLPPDPWKYRNIHLKLRRLLFGYSSKVIPKSIDEFILDFKKAPLLYGFSSDDMVAQYKNVLSEKLSIEDIALKIKKRIKNEIGDWLTVSIGVAPNFFLAKLASNLHKPDGFDKIDKNNFLEVFEKLSLTDLPYIKGRNAARLNIAGIYSVLDFYNAPMWKLRSAFHSVDSYYWYTRLHGYEIDDVAFARRSYGNSYALPKAFSNLSDLSPIIAKLTEKMGFRLRRAGYLAKGVHLAVGYRNGVFWHKGTVFQKELFDSKDIYDRLIAIFKLNPYKFPVRDIFVSVYDLKRIKNLQLDLFENVVRKRRLSQAVDGINERWGDFVIYPARMLLGDKEIVPDRIAFGGVKELEEFTLGSSY